MLPYMANSLLLHRVQEIFVSGSDQIKSMHTCAEVLELSDAEQTAALTAAFISSRKIAEVFAR